MYDPNWAEKYRRELGNHEVTLHQRFTSKDKQDRTHTIEVLVFKNPDSSFYRMEYIMKGTTLFVTGDCGEAAYWWSERHDLEWVSRCDLGYFAGKCRASEVGSDFHMWDERHAKRRVEDELKELEDEEKIRRFKKWGGFKNLFSHAEWMHWLEQPARGVEESTKGSYFFGDEWYRYTTDIGYVTHVRCELHLAGLKFAMEKNQHD